MTQQNTANSDNSGNGKIDTKIILPMHPGSPQNDNQEAETEQPSAHSPESDSDATVVTKMEEAPANHQTAFDEIVVNQNATTTIEPTPFSSQPPHAAPQEDENQDGNETMAPFTTTNTEAVDISQDDHQPLKISCYNCQQKLDVSYLVSFAHFNCPGCEANLIVPKWFDNYLLEEPGGAGGMATVYRALDMALDREVAIKILNPDVASAKERSELFLHEARTAATINHYAVIPIYTCGEYENQPYIIMQYMSAGSLEQKLKLERAGLPIKDVIKWIRDIAEGLDNAKRHGIIHHDIKPGNIMLDSEDNAKIGDFGIAQAVNDTRTDKIFEMTKAWVSPHYVSPEKVINGKEDFWGDIYSLGATFYHLITSFTPYDHNDIDELIRLRLKKDPIAPHHHRPEIPSEISRLILTMMDREPERRPAYREIIKILTSSLKGDTKKPKRPNTMTQSVKRTRTAMNMERLNNSIAQKTGKRKSPLLLFANTLALLLIAAVLFWGWQTGKIQKMLNLNSAAVKDNGTGIPEDLLKEATAAFSAGDSKKAEKLAKEAFENASAELSKRKQAAVQLALANFLNRNNEAKNNCSFIVERLYAAEIDETSPHIAIISFLEKSEISAETLKAKLENEKYLRLPGMLAILLRDMYNNAPSKKISQSFAAYYAASTSLKKDYGGKVWKGRLPEWQNCLLSKTGDKKTLEPLFARKVKKAISKKWRTKAKPTSSSVKTHKSASSADSSIKLYQLNAQWLAKHRKFASQRPSPKGFAMSASALNNYLNSLPPAKKQIEKQRSEQVLLIKSSLCKFLKKIPYESENIKLNSGRVLSGKLVGNMNGLSLKTPDGKRIKLKWQDISQEEFVKIMLHYTKLRQEPIENGIITSPKKRLEVAWSYLQLAIFCDWNKRYDLASEYAKKAAKFDPGIEKQIQKYILN